MKTITFRWLVRQTAIRNPRFGETREDVLRWGVYPYIQRPDGYRVFPDQDHPFSTHRSLEAAHAAVRRECERRYGAPVKQPPTQIETALRVIRSREAMRARRGA